MEDVILSCPKCFWTFKFTHTKQCPQCGGETKKGVRIDNRAWLARQNELSTSENARKSRTTQCCYTAKHSRDFHHDSNCPKHNMVY